MTTAGPPDEPSELRKLQPASQQVDGPAALQLLAAATRALAALSPDADDAALLAVLGGVIVPALGDVCLLHAASTTGELHLIGVEPADSELARRLPAVLEQHGVVMVVYEALLDEPGPLLVSATGAEPGGAETRDDDLGEHVLALRAAGLNTEIVAPLHAGQDGDALLVIDRIRDRTGDRPGGDHLKGDHPDGSSDLLLVELLGALVSNWRAARELRRREGALRQQVEELALAGRELAHLLNNNLTMPVGAIELLMDRSTLSAELQEMVAAAASDLAALERHVRQFQEQMRSQSGARTPTATRPDSPG